MQPYFYPYLDYFRLANNSDLFVLLDDVQFPRRGWVHRNRFTNYIGDLDWLTLSLRKGSQENLRIMDLEFTDTAKEKLITAINKFPVLKKSLVTSVFYENFYNTDCSVIDYLETSIIATNNILGIKTPVVRSSTVQRKSTHGGSKRIISLVKELEGTIYLNSPGGKDLYDEHEFLAENIQLQFLPETKNSRVSTLERLLVDTLPTLRTELQGNL
jgi:hypothetical protein